MKTAGFLVLFGISGIAAAKVESGPMVGHTTSDSVTLWAYDPPSRSLEFACWPAKAPDAGKIQAGVERLEPETPVFRHTFTGLAPATDYRYRIGPAGGEMTDGHFTTAPELGKPARFRFALTSCMDAKGFPVQPAWDAVLEREPDFHLMIGDNVYANSTRYDVLLKHHLKQRAVPNFARLLATTPNWAIWDDHDFGPNDSHAATPGKEESLRAFRHLWANPSYGTPDTPGVFHSFAWADVDFFMLDDRYHRVEEKSLNSPEKTQFGEAQLDWLFEGLRRSRATFKIVATGYDIMSTRYPDETVRVATRIRESKIAGVIFLSGDIHRNEFKRQDHGMGYPMTQITSSGIARNPIRPWTLIEIDTTLEDPMLTARFFTEEKSVASHPVTLRELTPPAD